MKKSIINFFVYAAILAIALCGANPAMAHGGEPRLEISTEKLNPGATLEVRGVDFEQEETIALSLIGANIDIALVEVIADVEGGFTQAIVLPADLPEGEYHIRAVTDDHDLTSPLLTVFGPAITNAEDGQRAEDDPLLAPMPTFAPGAVPATVIPHDNVKDKPQMPANKLPISAIVIVALMVGAGIVFIQRRRTS